MKYVWILCLLTSCLYPKREEMSFAELDLRLSEEWMYAEKIEHLKYEGEEILRPPGVEQLVMALILPQKDGVVLKKHCVYFQVPYKKSEGQFKVQEIKNEETCPESSSEEGKIFLSVSGMGHLKISFLRFKLFLEFEYRGQKVKMEIPTPNIVKGVQHEKYHAMKRQSLMNGLKFLRLNESSFDGDQNRYLGNLSDRFSKGSAIRCYQVGKDCKMIGENRCDQCRFGHYEVVDFNCPQGGSRFCGQNHCGEKNEPACPRGSKVVGEDVEDAGDTGDPGDPDKRGICQSDLSVVKNADHILVCQ